MLHIVTYATCEYTNAHEEHLNVQSGTIRTKLAVALPSGDGRMKRLVKENINFLYYYI